MISRQPPVVADDSASHYDRAYELEDDDPEAAIEAYQRCLAAKEDHLEARPNCGRLLHLAGRLAEAERIYRGRRTQTARCSLI